MNAQLAPRRSSSTRLAQSRLICAIALSAVLGAPPAQAVTAKMAIEHRHALWIDQGNVYGVGANAWCSTTQSNPWDTMLPTPIFTGDRQAISVAAAGLQSAILFANGSAMFRGISNAPIADRYCYQAPFPMRDITDIALLGGGTPEGGVLFISGGQVYRWTGLVADPPVAMAGGAGAKSISAGNMHVVVVYCDGSVATWGANSNGQLGRPPYDFGPGWGLVRLGPSELIKLPMTGVETAHASGHTTLLRLKDGRTFVFGAVNIGFLPSPGSASGYSGGNQTVPAQMDSMPANTVKIGLTGSTVYALTGDGRVFATGWEDQPFPLSGRYLRGFVQQPYPLVKDLSIGQYGVLFDLGIPGQRHSGLTGRIADVTPTSELLEPSTGVTVLRSFSFSPMPASLTSAESDAAESRLRACSPLRTPPSPEKDKGNNGFGNGDQSAPGNSAGNNNAENSERLAAEAKAKADAAAKAKAEEAAKAKAKADATAKAQAEAQAKAAAAAEAKAKAAAEAKAKAEAAAKAKADAAAKAQAEAQAKAAAAAEAKAKAAAEAKAKAEAAAKAKAEAAAKAQAEAQAKAAAAAEAKAKAAAEAMAKAEAAAKAKAEAAAKAQAEAQAKAKTDADTKPAPKAGPG